MKKTRVHISLYFLTAIIGFPFIAALGEAHKIPFLDMNDVRDIQVNGNILSFVNPNGILKFDTFNQSWNLESKQTVYHKTKRKSQYTASKAFVFPDWVPSSSYRGIKDQFFLNHNDFWLTQVVSEGSAYIDDVVIDNQNRAIYSIPYQNSQSLEIYGDSIWLGHPRGITQINRISRQRIDYELWPKYETITGWVKYENSYYLSTSDGEFFSFNPVSGEIKRLPVPYHSFDRLFISMESKKKSKKAQYYFTNPVLRGTFLTVGVIPIDPASGVVLGQSGIITFDLNDSGDSVMVKNLDLEISGRVKNPASNLGIKKLVKINNDIFLLGNYRGYFEGGEFSETGGVAILNESGRLFDIPECGNKPVVAIKIRTKNKISILQQSINPKTEGFSYFECNIILNEPDENRIVSRELAKTTYRVGVLEKVVLRNNDPKIEQYEFLNFGLSSQETTELIKNWKVKPKLKIIYNRSLRVEDYHSPMVQEIDGLIYPVKKEMFLNLSR